MSNLADVFTKYKAVVFFDTETSGLDADTCQIIELAAIRIEQTARGTLRMADTADMFVKLPEGEKLPEQHHQPDRDHRGRSCSTLHRHAPGRPGAAGGPQRTVRSPFLPGYDLAARR